ncbi:MAG: site-specific integrase, partial [Gammaproteobacteria bacterium]|nr:site-specific integrase [Gammaproteobacteria bacterium]
MSQFPLPCPLFDNLDQLSDPFKLKHFEAALPASTSIRPQDANLDYEYAWKFMWSYNGSVATFNAYRREVERLLQWAWLIRQEAVLKLKREDIEQFIRFCQKPHSRWIATKHHSRFKSKNGQRIANLDWRPFVVTGSKSAHRQGHVLDVKNYLASKSSVQATFSILSSFYGYLMQEGICELNPVSLIRQKSKFLIKQQQQAPVRRISNLQWDYVIETIEQLANQQPERFERSLFIMNALYAMYLRVSELVWDKRSQPVMGDFRKDQDGNWWFHVLGKGNKDRIITVSNAMLQALKRYRKFLGLSPLPSPDDATPLVSKQLGHGAICSTRQIRIIVQEAFDLAYQRMQNDGLEE